MVVWWQTLRSKESLMSKAEQQEQGRKNEHDHGFQIQIDRVHYTVAKAQMTGAELRGLSAPPVEADRDLFEVVPGGSDRKIADEENVEIRNGLRFFTAPAHINPGATSHGVSP
jgi:hypothetical protein